MSVGASFADLAEVRRDWDNAEVKLVFEAVENTSYAYSLWAPEVHNIDDKWYFILWDMSP